MDIQELYSIFGKCGSVTTDSRRISGGEIFFALKGENFDGNGYAINALDSGAAYAVVEEGSQAAGQAENYRTDDGRSRLIIVKDTLAELQALARYHRERLSEKNGLIVIGITGTNGKTTTKDLIRDVLAEEFKVAATKGNLNNDIGVPLTLLGLTDDVKIAVIEMGANHPDDIARLVTVSEPDYGIITNVGRAHLQGFGSFEGVKKAKGALYDYINDHGKAVFINADDPELRSMAAGRKGLSLIPYGMEGCTICPTTADKPYLRLRFSDGKVLNTLLIGSYNCPNILAALCIGKYFGVDQDKAMSAISSYVPSGDRSQMIHTPYNEVIADAYNANPSSMTAALRNFSAIEARPKAVCLGDMRELGDDSLKSHEEILSLAMNSGFDRIFLVGDEFHKALDAKGMDYSGKAGLFWFQDSAMLFEYLSKETLDGFTVLVKGSRGIQMEKIFPAL